MARAMISDPKRHTTCEPMYDIDPQTGASVEIFYADRALAASFSTHAGWFWWACQPGLVPGGLPIGPFDTSYTAYRNFATRCAAALRGLDKTANAERESRSTLSLLRSENRHHIS